MSTNRKIQTENHVNLSISELMAIYDNAPIMMLLIDQDHRIKNANRAAITYTDRQEKTIERFKRGEYRC